ncbi:MAG: putative dimethylaniline monooxygenase [Actinomycetia bacterium]|nr:putative dimethylaniline monooxygenase [Actinomycetes bacterium]
MTTTTSLLVIGAGPYALSCAALAREHGIDTVTVGRPMGFWRRHMPAGMLLRSGPDWHLDASGVHTLEAYLEERAVDPADVDPLPIGLFLDYAEWFRQAKGIGVREDLVVDLTKPDDRFEAVLESGERIVADAVVAAPGIRNFTNLPAWAGSVPAGRAAHTCDLVRFEDLSGARILIVGGRQSAYEWAALLVEQGAARIDLVHRHDVPRFERVSWKFVDAYLETTVRVPGWWRSLPRAEQDAITRRFWEVGRLTLEYWLTPRLASPAIHRWPGTEVVRAEPTAAGDLTVRLSNGDDLRVDQVIFACGYRADLARVPYLAGVLDRVEVADGFPVLDEAFGASLPRLYLPGFAATRDFGPFFGFVKGTAAAATLMVNDLLVRA